VKPVFLRFAGLHSYIDEQQVDFPRLLGAGVFGIFGPTGSGKSTILDAMTLALYGSVDRAAHNTQGIINHDSDQLAVAYTFELSDASATRRYRAERTFRRGKSFDSVEAVQARFVELDRGEPGEEDVLHVLADKARAVTAQVEEILGLTLGDFTRAVVLPQGKFAEFLALQGAERRSMLQRLFGLEIYGDRLCERVRVRLQTVSGELGSVRAALSELGEASSEVLAEARSRLEEAEQTQAVAVAAAEEVQRKVEKWQRVWEWQGELAKVSHDEQQLDKRRVQIEAMQRELGDAERAERVRTPLQTFSEARRRREEAIASENVARDHEKQAREVLERAATARQAAETDYVTESPELFRRQAELRTALEQQRKRTQLANALSSLEEEISRLAKSFQELEKSGARAAGEAAEAEKQLQRVQEQVAQRTVDPDERRRLTAAVAALRRYADARQQLVREQQTKEDDEKALFEAELGATEAQALAHELQDADKESEERLADHLHKRPWQREELEFRRRALHADMRTAERVLVLLSELSKVALGLEGLQAEVADSRDAEAAARASLAACELAWQEAQERLRVALEEQEAAHQKDLAATLAIHLRRGEACPVCGSKAHPRPSSGHAGEAIAVIKQRVEECQKEADQANQAFAKAKESHITKSSARQSIEERQTQVAVDYQRLHEQLAHARAPLPKTWRTMNASELAQEIAQSEQSFKEHEEALQRWEVEQEQLEKARQLLAKDVAAAERKQASTDAQHDSARKAHAAACARVADAQERCTDMEAELRELSAGASPEEICHAAQRLERWDKELQTLRKRAAAYEKQAKEAAHRIEQVRQAREQLGRDIAIAQERRHGAVQQDEQLAAEIARLVGPGMAPEEVARQVAECLQALADARDSTAQAEEQAQGQWQQAAQTHAGATERLQGAIERENSAHLAIKQALADAGFATVQEAEGALLSEADQKSLHMQIDDYHQSWLRLQSERQRLERLLGGRSLSQQEWEGWRERLAGAQATRDTALQECAVAATTWCELKARHERWQELVQQEASLSELAGRLSDLRSIFAGGAFVDFLAQEQLNQVLDDASMHLGQLTHYRYALEAGSDGSFVIRDDLNGGYKRTVNTLSGGETFLASLALALALSSQIQLRGRFPLEFFFLDEGFGSLDQETLDIVMTALERLHVGHLHVGVISHVQELRNRIQRSLTVLPAIAGERGSQIRMA
jgi:exonuclease SbcC